MHDELEKRLKQLKQHLSTPGLDAEKITSSNNPYIFSSVAQYGNLSITVT